MKKENPPKLPKGQKCFMCKKEIKKEWAYNGHYFCGKCKDIDSANRINKYFKKEDMKNKLISKACEFSPARKKSKRKGKYGTRPSR